MKEYKKSEMKLNSEDLSELDTLEINAVKSPVFWKKMKSEMKLNSEDLSELSTLEISAICRIQYFLWYCLNTKLFEFNNFNINTVNAIQLKHVFVR